MDKDGIRVIERGSIRRFLEDNRQYLAGEVLDFGSGKQPYKDLCGNYTPYEKGEDLPSRKFDTILCNQVLQYIERPDYAIKLFKDLLKPNGYLVMTYPTHWEEVCQDDWWRFTKRGVERLLKEAGFQIIIHQERWSLPFDDFKLVGGYGVIARNSDTNN
jgi:SAM-dependent methyltransferase